MKDSFYINELPVYWRVKKREEKKHKTIPEKLDISLQINPENGALSQSTNPKLEQILLDIYSEDENIGYLRDDNQLAVGYHKDLSNFLKRVLAQFNADKVLEIGCGGCTVLGELKLNGYNVTGMDPSPFALKCANERAIPLIQDFFKPELIRDNYDLVYFSDVLEHVFNPILFLNELRESINSKCVIVIAVPDATSESISGDYSMLMHQHITYFTEATLRNTLSAAGLSCIHIQKAGYGGSLYAVAQAKGVDVGKQGLNIVSDGYFDRAWQTKNKFQGLFNRLESNHSRILCYVPLRAIPYLASIGKLDSDSVYFIDDTPFWKDRLIDGTKHLIRPLVSYDKKKDDCILIFSNTFGSLIKQRVIERYGKNSQTIHTLDDFCSVS